MNKLCSLAGAFLLLSVTCALAESWVTDGKLQYDSDSAYIGASSGLLYFTVCMADKCVAGDEDQMVMYMRYDCDTGMESNLEAFEAVWTKPVAHGHDFADLESKLCAQRASLPRHQ